MPFPPGTPTKVVNLTVKNAAGGTPVRGGIRFEPNVPEVLIDGSPVRWTGGGSYRFDAQGRLMSSDGMTPGVELLDNSVGSNPRDWLWRAYITINGKTRAALFSLKGFSSGSTLDLNKLIEVDPNAPNYIPTPGPKGDRGEQGLQGIQGIKGDKGDQGLQGIQGNKGDKGDKGDPGVSGGSSKTVEVTVIDDDLSGLPGTATWQVVQTTGGTYLQGSIDAVPGDRIELVADFLYLGSHYMDWVAVNKTSGGILYYGTSRSATPPTEGRPGLYPILTASKVSAAPMFTADSNIIGTDGKVTIGLAHIGPANGASNRVYAHPTYPFYMRLKNIGPNPS